MKYRLLLISEFYSEFLKLFLKRHPDYKSMLYDELYKNLFDSHFGWSDYPNHFDNLDIDSIAVVPHFKLLQQKWAFEKGFKYSASNWVQDIVIAQILDFGPDVIFFQNADFLNPNLFSKIKNQYKKRCLFCGYRSTLIEDYSKNQNIDILFTGNTTLQERFLKYRSNVFCLYHAFEPKILDLINQDEIKSQYDFTFLGNIGTNAGIHSIRFKFIENLLSQTPLEIWTSQKQHQLNTLLLNQFCYISNSLLMNYISVNHRKLIPVLRRAVKLTEFPKKSKILSMAKNRIHFPLYGLDYYKIIAHTKVSFNNHIDFAGDAGGNIRLFEATGLGSCLLTDNKSNNSTFFEPDKEIVVYTSVDDCIEKVKYLLAHESERKKIADSGKKRTLRDHTFVNRAKFINEIILEKLNK